MNPTLTVEPQPRPVLGLCQWFHYLDRPAVERTIELMGELGVTHLRTGLSWADFYRDGGPAWYDWQMRTLRDAGLNVLLSIWHTPPSISEGHVCNAPPRRLQDYADFLDLVIDRYGETFDDLELWNEPNNRMKWDFQRFDPRWAKFGEMIRMAAYWARARGKRTVLGGMIPVDPDWLERMDRAGALDSIDAVAIHGFPGMWWDDAPNWDWYRQWNGWAGKVELIAPVAGQRPIWITETGLATCDVKTGEPMRHDLQIRMLRRAAEAPVERVYWYSLIDLDPAREAIEGFHVDENEYHLGLVTFAGQKKPAFDVFRELVREQREQHASPTALGPQRRASHRRTSSTRT